MTFGESISTCFAKYANFDGRASRSEFWWFMLFVLLVSAACSIVSAKLSALFHLGVLLPCLSAGARRLHDTNRSGWLQLLGLIPVAGLIVLLVFWIGEAREPNRFAS